MRGSMALVSAETSPKLKVTDTIERAAIVTFLTSGNGPLLGFFASYLGDMGLVDPQAPA
jgi:hypothetical protein